MLAMTDRFLHANAIISLKQNPSPKPCPLGKYPYLSRLIPVEIMLYKSPTTHVTRWPWNFIYSYTLATCKRQRGTPAVKSACTYTRLQKIMHPGPVLKQLCKLSEKFE
jgi:hypothetical protein